MNRDLFNVFRESQIAPRPWLLPILKDHLYNTELAHFREVMIPIAKQVKSKAEHFELNEKQVEYRIYRTIYEQIWSLLPSYCSYAIDMIEVSLRTDLSFPMVNLIFLSRNFLNLLKSFSK